MARPLPDDVARTARAYLATLLPPADVSDAWHELVADVDYWGDRDLLPVVRLAHQVVLQHQRLAPEVAVLALAEVGVDDPGSMAAVLDADPDQVARWADEVASERDTAAPCDPPAPTVREEPVEADEPTAPRATTEPAAPAEAVRIGFDDDPLPDLEGGGVRGTGRRDLLIATATLAMLVLAVWLVTR